MSEKGFESHRMRYRVTGMDCGACAAKIENALLRLPGVAGASASATTGKLSVAHDGGPGIAQAVREAVAQLGYGIASEDDAPASHEALHNHDAAPGVPWWRTRKGLLTVGCGLALVTAYLLGKALPTTERWVFLLALAVGLVPIARRAAIAAFAGTPFSIETLMTIAAVGAVLIGAVEEAGTVVFLFLVGELLEGVAAGKARASIQALTNLAPEVALLEQDGSTAEVPAKGLQVGATVLVRPGDRLPADGIILSGESAIDEAPVTGESVPKSKGPNEAVFAGTINGDGAIRVRVTAAAQDNTIARVVRLVEEAQEAKAPTERFIDRFSRYYTPGVLVVGALVAVMPPVLIGAPWAEWIYKGLAILLIGCPCALVISTPAAIAAGLSVGARRGLLLKGGAVLEAIGRITVAAFDKTGTLSEGKPKVTDVIGVTRSEREVLSLAAALETGSSHPLAIAILDKAANAGAPVPPAANAAAVAGKGVTGTVGGLHCFLGSAKAAAERTTVTAQATLQISALNGEGKTVSILLVGKTSPV